jgi:hypothetical protein
VVRESVSKKMIDIVPHENDTATCAIRAVPADHALIAFKPGLMD